MSIKEYKLGEICNVFIGKTPSTLNKKFWDKKEIEFLDGSLSKKRYITREAVFENNIVMSEKNDILMTILGNFYFMYCLSNYAYNQQVALIKLKSNVLLSRYLYYYLLKNKKQFDMNSIGTTVKHLNKKIIENTKLKVIDIETQQQIIDIIEPFENYKDTISKEVELILDVGERFATFIDKTIKLSEISNITSGSAPPQKEKYWINGTIPFINIKDLTNTPFVTQSSIFMNQYGFDKYNCKIVTKNSILIGKVGPEKNKVSLSSGGFVANGAIRIVTPYNLKDISQIFFNIRNKDVYLRKLAHGAVQQQLNTKQLEEFDINFDRNFNEFYNAMANLVKTKIKIKNCLSIIIEKLIEKNIL
ncbi:restriction endonuclease subunit S [Malacoplasma iowae]|uniref:restriction endonuclease subunit S n=1 Tax=Malacoplasma iowae TaxID=2116 RepID=UPI003873A59B|nr:restriction endonuclease subunit S [Malacoplasma iowae]